MLCYFGFGLVGMVRKLRMQCFVMEFCSVFLLQTVHTLVQPSDSVEAL